MIQVSGAEERRIINHGKFIIRTLPLGNALKNHNDQGIYQLGRLDHATLQGGVLVKMHLHHNDEILSYMRKGTMLHEDNHGTKVPIHSTYLMMMNAGSGLHHEESVPEGGETVEMLQIFLRPRADELPPSVQFHTLNEAYSME
jgi:redox-sensitive bicupin YhaK (pirin superfamily)